MLHRTARRTLRHLLIALALLFAQQAAQLHALTHLKYDLAKLASGDRGVPPIGHPAEQCIAFHAVDSALANSGVAIYKCINDHGVWVPKDGIDRLVLFIDTWDRMLKENGPYYAHLAQLERKRFLRKLTL